MDRALKRSPSVRLSWRCSIGCFLAVWALCLSGLTVTNYDSYLSIPTAWSVLSRRTLSLDAYDAPLVVAHYGNVELDGHHYDFYPWPTSLFGVPMVAAVAATHRLGLSPSPDELIRTNRMGVLHWILSGAVVALAAAVVARTAFERRRGLSALGAVAVGTAFVATTMMWSTASRALWQHGPAALLLSLGLLHAQRYCFARSGQGAPTSKPAFFAALFLTAAYTTRPTAIIAAACIAAAMTWVAVRVRPPAKLGADIGAALAGSALVIVPFVMVNVASYGRLLPPSFGATRLALHADYAEAVLANLISPGRGLLVYSPVLLVALAQLVVVVRRGERLEPLTVACLIAVVVHLLVVSAGSEAWWAGHSYGARFLTEMTPLMAYLAVPLVGRPLRTTRTMRVALAVAIALGVATNAPGVYFASSLCWNVDPVDINTDPERVWSWSAPPFLFAAQAFASGTPVGQVVRGPCADPASSS